jgi:YVTN family beta-propeller protein
VANWGLQQVQVIEVSSNTIVDQIPVGAAPLKVWMAHDGQHFFVSNHNGNSVTVIDANTWQVVATVPVGVNPRNICTSMNDSLLFTANWGSRSVSVVDLSTYQVVDTIAVDHWPQAILPTPDGRYILVANFGFDLSYDHITVIRTSDHVVIARLQTGAGPEDMLTIGADGQYLYVSNWGMSCCFNTAWDACCTAEVDKATLSVIALPDFEAWVAADSIPSEVPYIRSTLTSTPLHAEYGFGMAAHPNGRYVFAANMGSNSLSVVGLQDLSAMVTDLERTGPSRIWPIPARDHLRISGCDGIQRVRLLDLGGREVRRWMPVDRSATLDISGILPGGYLVELTSRVGITVHELVIY